jgi:hypothetical protein
MGIALVPIIIALGHAGVLRPWFPNEGPAVGATQRRTIRSPGRWRHRQDIDDRGEHRQQRSKDSLGKAALGEARDHVPQFKALLIANWEYAEGDPSQTRCADRGTTCRAEECSRDSRFGLFGPADGRDAGTCGRPDVGARGAFTDDARRRPVHLLHRARSGQPTPKELGLCGVDATAETLTSRFRASTSNMDQDARATSRVVVLDCCYSGAYDGAGQYGLADLDRSFGSGVRC